MKPDLLNQSEARIDRMIESNNDLARKTTEALFIIGYFKGRVDAERLELLTLKTRMEKCRGNPRGCPGRPQGPPLRED